MQMAAKRHAHLSGAGCARPRPDPECSPRAGRPGVGVDIEDIAFTARKRQSGEESTCGFIELGARPADGGAGVGVQVLVGTGHCRIMIAEELLPRSATAPASTFARIVSTTHAGSAP